MIKAIVVRGDGFLILYEENEKSFVLELASGFADHGDHLLVFVPARG